MECGIGVVVYKTKTPGKCSCWVLDRKHHENIYRDWEPERMRQAVDRLYEEEEETIEESVATVVIVGVKCDRAPHQMLELPRSPRHRGGTSLILESGVRRNR